MSVALHVILTTKLNILYIISGTLLLSVVAVDFGELFANELLGLSLVFMC